MSNIPLLQGPFTTTRFFNYFDSFLTGLNLKTWYNSSRECFEPIYFLIDDGYFVRVNFTSENRTVLGVVLNVTNVIGTNLADTLPNCVLFGRSIINQTFGSWERFDRSYGKVILSFAFNQMSIAPQIP